MTYLKDGQRESAIINKKDFLNKVVNVECPETKALIDQFQIKTLDSTLKATFFEVPTSLSHCETVHEAWINNSKTPFLCQIHEYIKDAKSGAGEAKDLTQRRAMAKILEKKQSPLQKDYIRNLCSHLDNVNLFCEDFLNVSFWSKITSGVADKIYAEDICKKFTNGNPPSVSQMESCLIQLKKQNDICHIPHESSKGLFPQPECSQLSEALNHSILKANYRDCPGTSDQHAVTNIARILSHSSEEKEKPFTGSCSSISTGQFFNFNKTFDNEENWPLEACYDNKLQEKEVCYKTFFGSFETHPQSYTNVVAEILRNTRGADSGIKCKMVSSVEYNPLLLDFKSGCHIVYEKDQCFISQCKHKVLYNDRAIDFIRIKGPLTVNYFPLSIKEERFSQSYLLTHDYKKTGTSLSSLSAITRYFKINRQAILHGVGCAEDLLPSFFKAEVLNQCSPLPFIIDGIITDKDKSVFVTRTAVDSLQGPRLVSWSAVYSAVKSYQRLHPLRLWTLYGLH